MGRVLKYWLALGPLAAAVAYGASFLLFRDIDLSFAQFATLLTVPLLQAVVLAWRAERPSDAIATLGRTVARHPLAQPVLALDVLVLGAGVVGWDSHVIGFGAAVNIHATWTLVKAAAAVVFSIGAVGRSKRRERGALALRISAPLLLVFALEPTTSWLAAGFAQVHTWVGARGEVVQRLVFYGPLFSLVMALTLASARGIRARSREASQLLEVATAAAVGFAVAVILATFNTPILTEPWRGFAALSASCAASSVLLAAVFLASSPSTATDDREP